MAAAAAEEEKEGRGSKGLKFWVEEEEELEELREEELE